MTPFPHVMFEWIISYSFQIVRLLVLSKMIHMIIIICGPENDFFGPQNEFVHDIDLQYKEQKKSGSKVGKVRSDLKIYYYT